MKSGRAFATRFIANSKVLELPIRAQTKAQSLAQKFMIKTLSHRKREAVLRVL